MCVRRFVSLDNVSIVVAVIAPLIEVRFGGGAGEIGRYEL